MPLRDRRDADKRKASTAGEIDAEGKPRFQGFEGFGAGPRPADRAASAAGKVGLRLHLRPKASSARAVAPAAAPADAAVRGHPQGRFFRNARRPWRAAGRAVSGSSRRMRAAGGSDVAASLTVTLAEAPGREETRASADRQGG